MAFVPACSSLQSAPGTKWVRSSFDHVPGRFSVQNDAKGVILDGKATPGTWSKLERTHFVPGADWSEERAGTNAIMVGASRRKCLPRNIFVRVGIRGFVSAAPIKIPVTGTLLGVLDVTGKKNLVQAHDLHLVSFYR